MEDKKRARQRSTPEQFIVEKHGFKKKIRVFFLQWDQGKGYGGLMVVERRVLKHKCNKEGGKAAWSGRGAAAAPHERSPGKELQVQPLGPWVSGKTGGTSLAFCFVFLNRFVTFHIQRVSPWLISNKIFFWLRTVLFFSDNVSCVKCAIPPPCFSSVSRTLFPQHFLRVLAPFLF